MTQINPFTGSILQAPTVQRQQAAQKDRQLRRVSDLEKNAALDDDQLEHQVESSDVVAPVHADDEHHEQKRKSKKRLADSNRAATSNDDDQPPPHVDLTA